MKKSGDLKNEEERRPEECRPGQARRSTTRHLHLKRHKPNAEKSKDKRNYWATISITRCVLGKRIIKISQAQAKINFRANAR
jgi:hypothetical protein